MELSLKRRPTFKGATIGELYIDGDLECFTLEDAVREVPGKPVSAWKIPKQTAIPRGRYRVTIDMSTAFHKMMLHILDVPGFAGIRIHKGNDIDDTEGCILVGLHATQTTVTQSKLAFDPLFDKIQSALNDGQSVFISIE